MSLETRREPLGEGFEHSMGGECGVAARHGHDLQVWRG